MATAFGTAATASAASSVKANNAPKSSAHLPLCHRHFYRSHSKVSFRIPHKPKLRFCSNKGLQSSWNRSAVPKAQLNEVSVGGSSNAAANAPPNSADAEDLKPSSKPVPVASEESISEFMSQVASLVKLVDSKDIVELELKQLDCELLIRKKEALPPPPSPPAARAISAAPVPAPAPVPITAAAPAPAPVPAAAPAAESAKSSLPPLKSPIAGTFYRSPGPGEPPFVKIGDKVKKGQILCIIEAMKMMNEIEADQPGTIVEIVAEDGDPISIGAPLLVIEPQ